MNLIARYILRNHFAPFLFGFFTVIFLFLMQFVMGNLDELVGKGISYGVILHLVGLNLAWMVVLAAPMGVLFSTLMGFGAMSAAHEITVIKAGGAGLTKMMTPVVIFAMLLSIGMFYFNDIVLPESNHQAKILLSDIKRTKPTFALESGRFTTELDGYTILARDLDSVSGQMRGVTIYSSGSYTGDKNVISADSGYVNFANNFSKLVIDLFDGEIIQFRDFEVDNQKKIEFKTYQIRLNAYGFAFSRSDGDVMSRGQREMRIVDMEAVVEEAMGRANEVKGSLNVEKNKYTKFINSGIMDSSNIFGGKAELFFDKPGEISENDIEKAKTRANNRISFLESKIRSDIYVEKDALNRAREYQVEIWKKFSIPFACLVFALVGAPLGIITKGGNFGISSAISLGFYILYWASLIGGEKLADRGIVSPFLGMWFGNTLIGIMGVLLILKVNYEFEFKSLFKKN